MVDDIHIPETMHIVDPPAQPPASQPIEREVDPDGGTEIIERVREPSARESAMAEIFKNREKAIAKELHYGEDLADRAREDAGEQALIHERLDVDGAEPVDPPAVARAPAAPVVPVAPAAPVEPQMHDINVQGRAYRVTTEQLQQLASVGAVALDAANRQQVEPQQVQQQPQQRQPQQNPQQAQQQRPAPRPAPMLTTEESQALARRLQYGNDSESASALSDMTNLIAARLQAANPQINPERLAEYATQQAMQRIGAQQTLDHNLATIGGEFPEVFANSRLAQHAALVLHENRQRDAMLGVKKSDLDAYREACTDLVREFNLRPQPTPQPSPSPAQTIQPSQAGNMTSAASQAGRFAAKRAAPRSLQPAQRTLASPDQAKAHPSPSQIVAAMQKSRGQVV